MKHTDTLRLVLTALLAALICSATMFFRVPSPIGGYLHLGDGFVLLAAFLLGPFNGALAAGMGSMLADLLAGYPMYAAGTLVIKGLTALLAGAAHRALLGKAGRPDQPGSSISAMLVAGVAGELFMVAGYFAYSALCLGYGVGALAELPGNLCQAAAGVVFSTVLTPALFRHPEIRKLLHDSLH